VENVNLITVKEACALNRLSKSKIYQLLEQKVLRRVRLRSCNKVLLAESELRRYIEEGMQASV
jgi:excisionase family DNA binding protein